VTDDKPESIPLSSIRSEEGAEDLVQSENMKPYLDLIVADMQGQDVRPQLDEIRKLPLEKRYLWRIVSALKWAFADLETESIAADLQTLSPEQLAEIQDLLKLRPIQFCILLKTMFGAEQMKDLMLKAIVGAGKLP
jgi:hypothetical protein